jgi:hypothetical protein
MHMQALQLARLELEQRLEADRGDMTIRALEVVLTRCWGCNGRLRTIKEIKAGYLCVACQRKRVWARN